MKVTVYSWDEKFSLNNEGNYPDNMIKFIFKESKIEYDLDGLNEALKKHEMATGEIWEGWSDVQILKTYFRDHRSLKWIGDQIGVTSQSIARRIHKVCRQFNDLRGYKALILTGQSEDVDSLSMSDRKVIDVRSIDNDLMCNRTKNSLRRARPFHDITLGDVCNYSPHELMRLRNFGIDSLREVYNVMEFYGLSLKPCELPAQYKDDDHYNVCGYCHAAMHCKDENKKKTVVVVYGPKP